MKSRILISFLSLIAYLTNCYAQNNNLQIANGFMNEMRTFLIEEGFSPKLEDNYLNFKKEGVGYHLQITGTGAVYFLTPTLFEVQFSNCLIFKYGILKIG